MKIKPLILSTILILVNLSCVSKRKFTENQSKLNESLSKIERLQKLDSSRTYDLRKQEMLKAQLDKTEKVLAQIYLQYANNPPRKINESADYNLNAVIAEENHNLKKQIQNQSTLLDSLKFVISNNSPVSQSATNPPTKIKNNKKSKTEDNVENKSQGNLIQQLQYNLYIEREKNKQLEKSLNAYSLKLEIMDNQRLHETKGLKNSINNNLTIIDSLEKVASAQQMDIVQFKNDKIENAKISLKPNETKIKNQLKEKETELVLLKKELDDQKGKSTQLNKENSEYLIEKQKLETKLKELNVTNFELSAQLKNRKEEITSLQTQYKKEFTMEIEKFNSEIGKLQRNNFELDSTLSTFKNELQRQENEIKDLKKENEILLSENQKLTKELKESNNNSSNAEMEIQDKNINALRSTISELKETIENQNIQILELSKKASVSKQKDLNKEFTDSLNQKNNRIFELSQNLTQLKNSIILERKSTADSISGIEIKNKELTKIIEELTIQNLNLKTQLQGSYTYKENNSIPSKDTKIYEKNISTSVKDEIAKPIKQEKIVTKPKPLVQPDQIKEETLVKIQKILTEIGLPGMSIRKEEQQAILVLPQSYLYNAETLALSNDGSQLIIKLSSLLNKTKMIQIDIIAYSDSITQSDEFNLNRAKTISKLFKALGISTESLNTGSRAYIQNADGSHFSDGIEMIFRT